MTTKEKTELYLEKDIEELQRQMDDCRGMTIEEMIEADTYDVVTVEKVESRNDKGWATICWDRGTCGGFHLPDGVEPKVGDTLWLYPRAGLGAMPYGWALNGKIIKWETPWERFAKRVTWKADLDRKRREEYAERKPQQDADYEALPEPLKARIDRFRNEDPHFRIDSEFYEMLPCIDAPKIADALRRQEGVEKIKAMTDEEIDAIVWDFHKLDWKDQKKMVDGLNDGHSGNTFGAACMLAGRLLAGKDC